MLHKERPHPNHVVERVALCPAHAQLDLALGQGGVVDLVKLDERSFVRLPHYLAFGDEHHRRPCLLTRLHVRNDA